MILKKFCEENNLLLNDNQFLSLLCFAFDEESSSVIKEALLSRKKEEITKAFLSYNREKECELFFKSPTAQDFSIMKEDQGC